MTKDQRTIPYHWTGAALKDPQGRIIGITGIGRDVSAQEEAAEALQRQRHHLLEAQALAHLGSWEWDIESGETDWSEEQFRIFGHEPGAIAVTYDTFLAALLPDDHDRVLAAVNDALLGKCPLDLECRIVRPNGDIRVIHMRADVQRDATAHPIRMAGTALDITERKQAEDALRASEERWHLAIQGSNDGIWDWNIQSGEIFFSTRWKAMRGFADHEVTNHIDEWRSRIHPDDLDRVLQSLDHYLAKQTSAFCEEYRVQRNDGSYLWILDRGVALWAKDGTPVRMAGSETDITDRKLAEELLHKSVGRFDLAVQGSRDGLWYAERVSDNLFAPHNPIYYSPRMKEIMGVNNEVMPDVLGTWLSLVHPDDLPKVLAALTLHLEQHLPYDVEYRIHQHGTGTLRWIGAKGQAVWDSSGQPMRMAGSFSDITERKRAEHKLSLTQYTVDHAIDAFYWIDPQAKILDVNEAASLMLGYTKDELLALSVHDLNPAFQADRWPGFWAESKEQRSMQLETTHRTKEGRMIPVEIQVNHLTFEGKEFHCAYVRDITERKQAELALRESEGRTRSILETALDAVVSIDESGLIIGWNPQAEILFGYSARDVLGRPLDETIIPARYRQAHAHGMNRIVRGGEGSATKRRFEFFALHRSGQEFPVEFAIAASQVDGQPMFTAFIRDITERKQAEEALRESEERYRTLVELSPSGVFVFSEGKTVYVNSMAITILGATEPTDILARAPFEFIHPDYHEDVTKNLHRVLAGETTVHRAERVYLKMDGTPIHVQVEAVRITWNGKPAIQGFFSDITERKRAEEATTRSYDLLKSFVQHTPAAVAMLDKDLRYVAVSQRWLQDYRLDDQDLVGKRHYDVFPEICAMKEWHAIHQRCLDGAVERREEDRFVRADGSEDWLRWEVRPWQDVMGHIGGIIMFTEVITERKKAEEALRASEERFRAVVENAAIGIVVGSHLTGNGIDQANPAICAMTGYSPEELQSLGMQGLTHPDDLPASTALIARLYAGQAFHETMVKRYRKKDGTYLWAQTTVSVIHDAQGQYSSSVAMIQDITDRKQMEDRLRTTQYAVDHAADSIFFIGHDGYFLDVNESACLRLGYTKQELLTMSVMDIDPDFLPAVWESFWEEFKRTKLVHLETRHRSKSGEIYPVEVIANYLLHNGQEIDCAMVRDITERKQAEEALRRSERQLRTVLDTLPIGVWFTDEKGHVLYGNPVGHRIWAEAARVGLPQPGGDRLWWETIPQPELPHRWAVSRVLARGQDVQNETLAIETRTGERRTIRNSAVPVKSDTGDMQGAIVLNEDITDRVCAEKALYQKHTLLMAVMDAATDIIFVKDLEGRYIHINRAGAHALGMPVEEVIGWNDYAIWPSDLAASCQLADRRVLETGEPVTVEEISVRDGITTIYLTTKAPYRNSEGQIIGVIGVARDITEQKQAEEALRASERLFAKAFRASPNPIGITEVATGRCLDANQACLELFGFSREEVVGHPTLLLGIWPNPTDRDMLITRLQSSGPMRNEEMTFSTKSGDLRHVLVSSDLVDMNGKMCLITVGNDITERIRAEEALREQHALLSAIMHTTMDIIFVKDLQGHYLHMNPAGARAVGLSPQEVVGKDDDAIWPADLAACCKEADRRILSTGSAQTMEESTLADGKRITYLTTKAPYRDAAGNMIGIIGVAHDISQIKQSEEDLRRSHAFIRQIIDTDPNFIFAKDREGRFTLVNKAVAEAYGTSVERLIGKTDADFNSNTRELEFFRKKDLEVLDSLLEQFIAEEMITDSAGHTRWLQTVKRPILDESGKAAMVLGASTDITERKRIEETLRQRERDLRTALDERERISQDLHDGILQSLYAVGLGLEACKPLMTQRHYKKAAASMDRAIGHLNHVMSEVRNFIAGLESQILQGSTFPMALRTMVQTLTADHPIPCTLTIDESLGDTFSTEQALHLLNVVREALSNSLRHAEATKTTVSLKSLSRSIRLTIADNGRGFNPASMHGAGHGLANMEARARKVGGRFAIRSVPQQGTRITIDLPKETRHAESESEHGSTAARR